MIVLLFRKVFIIFIIIFLYNILKYNCNTIFLCFANIFIIVDGCNKKLMTSHNTDTPQVQSNNDDKKLNIFKQKRKDLVEISNVEEELQI